MTQTTVPGRARSSAQLGFTFRSILVQPRDGFSAALRSLERRARAGRRPAEGYSPYVLALAGGASMMLLWLKLGGLIGWRSFAGAEFDWSYLIAAAIMGAFLAVAVQLLWSVAGAAVSRASMDEGGARRLRLVWGLAALPHVAALVLLLPLDVVIVGHRSFTTERLTDPVDTTWAAVSISLSIALTVWSFYLLVRGVASVGGTTLPRAAATLAPAVVCAVLIVAALAVAAEVAR